MMMIMADNTKIVYAAGSAFVVGILSYYGILCATILAVIVGVSVYKVRSLLEIPEVPKLEEKWWGPRDPKQEDTSIEEFKIQVSDDTLNDLKDRLERTRQFTPSLEKTTQEYGINANLVKDIVQFWKNGYNWKEREIFLNQYSHYKVSIQGLKIHYVHVKPTNTEGKKVLPLMLVHGWPGSIREFYGIIPLLTTPQDNRDFVFELIIPSLPGFGFSEATSKPGLGPTQMAVVLKNLMKRVGFNRFYIQGGDWGSVIVQSMAILFPENVIGVHSNMPFSTTLRAKFLIMLGMIFPKLVVEDKYRSRMYPLKYNYEETGYQHIQGTKPDTVGFGLTDSPAGLAAYILEKFSTWTHPDMNKREEAGLKDKFTYTDLLDNIMIYWINGNITSSMRIYKEYFSAVIPGFNKLPITVPSGVARYSQEIMHHPDFVLKDKWPNIVHSSDLDGGHFAAFENPELLSKEICEFVAKAEVCKKKLD